MTTPPARRAFLGVDTSVSGRRWVGPSQEVDRRAEAMAQETRLPLPLARILVSRGVGPQDVARFLEPQLRDLLPDPRSLRDMPVAAARFFQAVVSLERIAIFADYDVDGGASAALLLTWLREFGHQATLYVPDRIDEGYGPNVTAMASLAAGHDLIVCVDCGTLSHQPVAAARPTDVVILDHHMAGDSLPPAVAVVNPNRRDETGDLGHLCAASVVFLMLVEVNRLMRETGRVGPDLLAMLDLVALATVADVAPLTGLNRAFVRQGLKVLARRERPGLRALADRARMHDTPSAYHLGYILGPRVNAGGRIGAADLGARLLSTDDLAEAAVLADRLEQLNSERREIEAQVCAEAMAQIEVRGTDGPLVWAAGADWHPGVVGIVAARLKEATNRPAVVLSLDGGLGKGSARSVAGVDLGAAVQRLLSENVILKGGGHRMAAGLTVAADRIPEAMDRLGALLSRQGAGAVPPDELHIDSLMMTAAATPAMIADIDRAGPFGQGAPAPRFAFGSVLIHNTRRIGTAHLRFGFSDGSGPILDAVAFGAFTGPLGPLLETNVRHPLHLAGGIEINHWNGRSRVQLRLDDAAFA